MNQISNDGKDRTRVHYRTFSHVFLYITERCQLRCQHCYMGDRLGRGLTMSLEKSTSIMNYCRNLGASNITILGGEPTLHPDLPRIIGQAEDIGYEKISIDTNGLLPGRLKCVPPESLNYVRVSLDGVTAQTNDKVRGAGTYDRTIRSIRELVGSGYSVGITSTVFQFSVDEAHSMLALADELGVKLVNYHVFSEEGLGGGHSNWSVRPQDWIEFCKSLETISQEYRTSIWYPPTWSTLERLERYVAEGYRGCLGCSLDRLSVFPDGVSYVCSLLFDEPVHFGTITDEGLILNRQENEFEMFTEAAFREPTPWLSGCPAEEVLGRHGKMETPPELVSICRCWKSQV